MEDSQKGKWIYVVTGVCIISVAIAFARLAYGVVLPYMREGLGISYQEAGMLGTATSFGYLCTVLLAGAAAKKWGAKRTILLGLAIIILGFAGLASIPSYSLSILFMCLTGIGTAFTFTSLVTILTGWFPSRKGLVIGFMNGGAGLGILLVGVLVPALHVAYPQTGWRITWAVFAVISLLVLVQTLFFIRNAPEKKSDAVQQTKGDLLKSVYLNRDVLLLAVIYAILGITYITQAVFMMSFMIQTGLSPILAGQFIMINGVLSIFSAPFWGALSDRIGRKKALLLATSLSLLATLLPVVYPSTLSFAVNSIVIGAIGTGLFTLIQALSTELVAPRDTPLALSYVTLFYASGQLIGPAAAGWVIDYAGGFSRAFLWSSLFILVSLAITTRLRRQKRELELDS
jgi:MFS family permease